MSDPKTSPADPLYSDSDSDSCPGLVSESDSETGLRPIPESSESESSDVDEMDMVSPVEWLLRRGHITAQNEANSRDPKKKTAAQEMVRRAEAKVQAAKTRLKEAKKKVVRAEAVKSEARRRTDDIVKELVHKHMQKEGGRGGRGGQEEGEGEGGRLEGGEEEEG